MKVSLNLIRFLNNTYGSGVDPYSFGVDEIIDRIGKQLGAVEEVLYTGQKYDGIVVVRIVSCEPHPDADKLLLCMVDDGGVVENVSRGDDGYIQVVCGAPNAREGLTAAWIPPGVAVPSTVGGDPFVLEAREIRGKVSNGMLASLKELAIGDDHDGILEILSEDVGEELTIPGTEFKKLYSLDDVIIDCENKMFTHRPDCFGTIGVGREILGIFERPYTSPGWYKSALRHEVESELSLTVDNQLKDLVPRFSVQAMTDVEVKKSPLWLQSYLSRIGQKSINNIVDYTNMFMMEAGQPLHAFDYDKIKNLSSGDAHIMPRMAKKGETLALLNGKTIELTDQDIVIATDTTPIALGGVMGGSDTEVDENTKNIIIEGANFDMYAIRRTSMRHGLFTDAVTRFNKGQSPLQNVQVIAKMVDDVKQFAGGKVASELKDVATFDVNADNLSRVEVSVGFINDRLGSSLSAEDMKTLLENVEFTVAIQDPSSEIQDLHITAPFWRMDIAIAEDIVEEVGRLYGYHKLPVELPPRASRPPAKNPVREFRQQLRSHMVSRGANEVLTHSFVHGDVLQNVGVDPDTWAYHLRNAISPELQYYRTSLIPSLLAKVHGNIKADAGDDTNEFALFEFGKAHIKGHTEENTDLPDQMRRLALVFAADDKTAKKYGGADASAYYHAKIYLDSLTNGQAEYQPLEDTQYPMTAPYQKGRSAVVSVNGQVLGVIGEFNQKARKSLKLPGYCAGFELDTDLLAEQLQPSRYKKLSTFPGTSQDITLELAAEHTWAHVYDFVHSEIAVAAAEDHYDYNVQPLDIYREVDSDKNRVSFRISLTHHQKTLKTTEVTAILDHVAQAASKTLKAKRI